MSKMNKKIINFEEDDKEIKCFVADDTDFEKSGRRMEFIGKIFNHAAHKYTLGFKCLILNYWNGKSMYALDFSIHIEQGKDKNQGRTA